MPNCIFKPPNRNVLLSCAIACVACFLFTSFGAIASTPSHHPLAIHILSATYGGNVNPAFSGNASADMSAICDGKEFCSYGITTSRLGDPSVGQPKDFSVRWTCGDGIMGNGTMQPEASGMVIGVSCRAGTVAPEPVLLHLNECEGTGGCGNWTLMGREGMANWPYGAVADLTIISLTSSHIILRRNDSSGTSPGLSAIYTGTIKGLTMQGDVAWTWPDHWSDQTVHGTWNATVAAVPSTPETPQMNPYDRDALLGLLGILAGASDDDNSDKCQGGITVELWNQFDRRCE